MSMNSDDWKNLVRGVAPTLATVLGGPAVGLGVKVLSDVLLGGSTGDPVKDEAALAGVLANGLTPEIQVKLIEAESKIKDQLFELRKLEMTYERESEKDALSDMQDARKRDAAFLAAGTRNYRADIMFGLAIGNCILLTMLIWKSPELSEFTKSMLTLVLGRFLGYVDNAYQFEYGTTRSNKTKDATIEMQARKLQDKE